MVLAALLPVPKLRDREMVDPLAGDGMFRTIRTRRGARVYHVRQLSWGLVREQFRGFLDRQSGGREEWEVVGAAFDTEVAMVSIRDIRSNPDIGRGSGSPAAGGVGMGEVGTDRALAELVAVGGRTARLFLRTLAGGVRCQGGLLGLWDSVSVAIYGDCIGAEIVLQSMDPPCGQARARYGDRNGENVEAGYRKGEEKAMTEMISVRRTFRKVRCSQITKWIRLWVVIVLVCRVVHTS